MDDMNMSDMEDPDTYDGSASKKCKTNQDTEIDNSKHLVTKIATLYAERLMNDICLEVDGVEYPAHRIILCTSSEVFQVMLMNSNWSESRTNRVVLQETKPCAEIFDKFLRYFYTGQISINESTVMPIITLADKYIVKDLMQVCTDYMCNHIASSENYVVSWYQYTLGLGHLAHNLVAQACQNYIKWNFESVAETPDFFNFTTESLCKFLTQNDIVVQNEMALLKYVMHWIEYQQESLYDDTSPQCEDQTNAHMKTLVENVICYIRFPMMTRKELAQLLLCPLVRAHKEFFIDRMTIGVAYHTENIICYITFPMMTRKELAQLLLCPLVRAHKEFFIDRMTIGVAYHTGSPEDIYHVLESKSVPDKLLFTPRLYTDAKFSSPLHISHFDSIPPYHSRTLVFSSHSNPSDSDEDERPVEWVIDVFPKGVWFDKFCLIVLQGTLELPQVIKKTVRVSITCKDPPPEDFEDLRVKFGILVYGAQNGVEYVKTVQVKTLRFNDKDRVFNFDDLLNYEELNPVRKSSANGAQLPRSAHLCSNVLKLNIIIIPLSAYSVTDAR
ncbi:hypothetical protein M8J77_003304 [Diaphorina citri]|nr:hypothetical protein M8J77_003304 [Diaphorina citri]